MTSNSGSNTSKKILLIKTPNRTTAATLVASTNGYTAFLPYVEKVTDRIGRILTSYNTKTVYKPTRNVSHLLCSVKDLRDPLSTAEVYWTPCSFGLIYVRTTHNAGSMHVSIVMLTLLFINNLIYFKTYHRITGLRT